MIRRRENMQEVPREGLLGGKGVVRMLQLLEPEEMKSKMRVCAVTTIPPGASVGHHAHAEDSEIYYVLEGEIRVRDNGEESLLREGDIMFSCNGDTHEAWNHTDKDAKVLFVVMLV